MSNILKNKIKSFFTIDNNSKIVIISLIISSFVSFASYSSYIVNGFVSPDGIIEGIHYFFNQAYHLSDGGRWLNVLTDKLHANLLSYWLIAVECFSFNWLSAHTMNKIINNKNKILYCISCALFPISPIIVQSHTYTYSAFPVCFGAFLTILFVYLNLQDNVYLSIIASFLLGAGIASTQSHIGIPVALTAFCIIKKIIDGEKSVYRFTLMSLLSGLGGGIVYFVVLNVFLKIYNVELSGRITAFSFSAIFSNFFSQVREIYKTFVSIFIDIKFKRIYIYLLLLVIFILEVLGTIVKMLKEKRYASLLITLLLILILPLCLYFISVIYPQSDIHGLMRLPNYISFFIIIGFRDYLLFDKKMIITSVLSLCLLFLTWTFILSANATFDSYRLSYNVYKEQFSSALDKVYELDDYKYNETKIVIIGFPNDEVMRTNIRMYDYAEDLPEHSLLYWAYTPDLAPYTNYQYLLNEFGIDTKDPMEIDDYLEFIDKEECIKMPSWPEKGSVQMIGEYAVIKFGNPYE